MEAVFAGASFDPLDCARQLVMDWDEVARLAAHPLAAIGAHGLHHLTSRQLDDDALREEFAGSKRIIEERIGRPVRHLAYPFGGAQAVGGREFRIARECGFVTAATTRCANLFPAHADALDRLPRLCISGNYPVITCLERLESGFTAAFANGWKRVVTE
jgi:peptidoglycan/xylan/chitin deacetylase (PgdA/CDA1 family)